MWMFYQSHKLFTIASLHDVESNFIDVVPYCESSSDLAIIIAQLRPNLAETERELILNVSRNIQDFPMKSTSLRQIIHVALESNMEVLPRHTWDIDQFNPLHVARFPSIQVLEYFVEPILEDVVPDFTTEDFHYLLSERHNCEDGESYHYPRFCIEMLEGTLRFHEVVFEHLDTYQNNEKMRITSMQFTTAKRGVVHTGKTDPARWK